VNGSLRGDDAVTTVDPAATTDGAAAGSSEAGATPGTSPAAGSPSDPSPGATTRTAPGTSPPTGFVALPELTVEIRGVDSIDYYAITGRNPGELNDSMKDDGPAGDHPAFEGYQDIAAQVEPDFTSLVPTFSVDRVTGSCRVTGLAGGATYRAMMPQWTAPARVPAALLAWWEEVLEHIRWHEEQHVRINDASIERLRAGLDGQPCPRVDAITTRWADDLNEAHLDFDREDDAWLPPLYLGPWDW
jgi:predicted secreted Zn-dependent protease